MRTTAVNSILSAGSVVLLAAYPFAVYALMGRGNVRIAGLALLAVLAIRFLTPGAPRLQTLAALVAGAVFAIAIALSNSETLARLYPVGVSAAMLAAFGVTLLRPPSMIERVARAAGASLDEAGVRYTRTVTIVWCAFFVGNGCIALGTALVGSRETWALYNGLLSYLLAGAILVGERLFREIARRRAAKPASE
jgi:uncharacterized membrane protein